MHSNRRKKRWLKNYCYAVYGLIVINQKYIYLCTVWCAMVYTRLANRNRHETNDFLWHRVVLRMASVRHQQNVSQTENVMRAMQLECELLIAAYCFFFFFLSEAFFFLSQSMSSSVFSWFRAKIERFFPSFFLFHLPFVAQKPKWPEDIDHQN